MAGTGGDVSWWNDKGKTAAAKVAAVAAGPATSVAGGNPVVGYALATFADDQLQGEGALGKYAEVQADLFGLGVDVGSKLINVVLPGSGKVVQAQQEVADQLIAGTLDLDDAVSAGLATVQLTEETDGQGFDWSTGAHLSDVQLAEQWEWPEMPARPSLGPVVVDAYWLEFITGAPKDQRQALARKTLELLKAGSGHTFTESAVQWMADFQNTGA